MLSQVFGVVVSTRLTKAEPQSSEAVSVGAVGMASHSTVRSVGSISLNIGAVVSSMVNVAVVVAVFPQLSVAVKITVAVPVVPQSLLSVVKLLVHVTLLQLSVAVAPALFCSHSNRETLLPLPSHSTVKLLALLVIIGAVLSSTVIVCVCGV